MVQVDSTQSSKIKIFSIDDIEEKMNWGIKSMGQFVIVMYGRFRICKDY